MSYSVYVSKAGGIPEDFFDSFAEAFKKMHKHDKIDSHGCSYVGGESFYMLPLGRRFISIPCHWDFEHMRETSEEVREVLMQLIKASAKIPTFDAVDSKHMFLGYEVIMSW